MPADVTTQVLADGFVWAEDPRWHAGQLWFSDVWGEKVLRVSLDGSLDEVATTPGRVPSGLGFLPTGETIVVSMTERKLLSIAPGGQVSEYADLSGAAKTHCNDMVVDAAGRAYVGAGFEMAGGPMPGPGSGQVILVDVDRKPRVVADGLDAPNGMVFGVDGKTLIVAESSGGRLTRFHMAADGSLAQPETFAAFTDRSPDGIAIDSEGAIWASTIMTGEFVRVVDGGEITDRVSFPGMWAVACALGGPDGRTLFMCTATNADGGIVGVDDFMQKKVRSRVCTTVVDTPGIF
jgi:sugar lactone lactonase YvrE